MNSTEHSTENAPESEPKRFALIGHPVGHSWSPFIHGMFAKQTERPLSYRLMDVPPEQFRTAAVQFFAEGGSGLNVTVPYKVAAAELVNAMTPRAERAGAVNTIRLEEAVGLVGDNTDGAGLLTDLTRNLGVELNNIRCLILGAGGAARGILGPLVDAGPGEIVIANRTPEKAQTLADEFNSEGNIRGVGFHKIPRGAFGLIINATAASLDGELPPMPDSVVDGDTVCYDMAYGKGDTSFTRWARQRRAGRVEKGWGMLIEQAAESFEFWHGVRPDTRPVLLALTTL